MIRGLKDGPDELLVKKQVNRGDVARFSKGSGADPSTLGYEEAEEILYRNGEPQRISGRIKASFARSTQANKDADEEES